MIRWYDFIAAFVFADFLLANAKIALFAPTMGSKLIGGFVVWSIYTVWCNIYCMWRLKQEMEKR